jgi:uncharacterized protein with HEPN domain
MARKTPRLYLEHIRESIALIEERVAGQTFESFVADGALRDSIERRIEIISEASRRLPDDMKARYPDIPWPALAAIGNVLRHEYYAIEPEVLWRIATAGSAPPHRRYRHPARRSPARLAEVSSSGIPRAACRTTSVKKPGNLRVSGLFGFRRRSGSFGSARRFPDPARGLNARWEFYPISADVAIVM